MGNHSLSVSRCGIYIGLFGITEMNKRIKELYAKANAWALHNYPPPVNPFEWEDLRSKKFAELIVQECIEQLVKEGDAWEQFSRNPPEGQKTNASAALFAAHRLKEDAVFRLEEHFGVEE
jgi:hypothetical protein